MMESQTERTLSVELFSTSVKVYTEKLSKNLISTEKKMFFKLSVLTYLYK